MDINNHILIFFYDLGADYFQISCKNQQIYFSIYQNIQQIIVIVYYSGLNTRFLCSFKSVGSGII